MKWIFFIGIFFMLNACNMVRWNQKQLSKKFERNGIVEGHFQNDEHSIRYFEGGEGETVLLLHGFGGDAQVTWRKMFMDLSENYHVIAPDLLWFGKSTSTATPNLDSQVDAVKDLLDDKKIDQTAIAGISYGGFVVTGLIYAYPDLFTKIGIIDCPGVTYDVANLDTLCATQGVKSVDEIFVVKTPEDIQELFDLGSYNQRNIPNGILEDIYTVYYDQHHEKLTKLILSLKEEQGRFAVDTTLSFAPTTIFWGEFDRVFPIEEGEKLADFMNADFQMIPNAGHAPNVENYKDFLVAFRSFLEN